MNKQLKLPVWLLLVIIALFCIGVYIISTQSDEINNLNIESRNKELNDTIKDVRDKFTKKVDSIVKQPKKEFKQLPKEPEKVKDAEFDTIVKYLKEFKP